MNEKGDHPHERRKQPDWMVKGSTILCVISWLLSISAVLVIDIAAPDQANLLTHLLGGEERAVWNTALILLAYIMLVLSVFACVAAFVFNILRMRRKTDKLKWSILSITILTVGGFLLFTFSFSQQLF
ncbi:MAG: hypothetical protein FWB88_06405 [Defluviitaleaceae bacterium]|nr:hypothetical protein [Defluviitaleaceae bacterium]MCL2239167.1 hypothetical protein [Defluviitaleaceae bacterium]